MGYKMKHKKSSFPFKSSPAKQMAQPIQPQMPAPGMGGGTMDPLATGAALGQTPMLDKAERQEKRRGRQLKRAKKKDRWMHGQEITGEKGQLKTLEDHSWSTGDKERKVKDPYGVISDDTPDYPSDDYRYYYKKNIKGDIKLLGKDEYPDLPAVEVKGKKKKKK